MMELFQAALIAMDMMMEYANIQRKKGADGYLTKIRIETEISESLTLWQTVIEIMKAHIHTNRRYFTEIARITNNLNENEILIHSD